MRKALDVLAQIITWVVIIGCIVGIPFALLWPL